MADRIVKPDTGNDLVIQNDDASAKIEVNEDGTVVATPSVQVDNIKIDGNTITSENTNGNIDLTPNGTGEVNISKVDIDSGSIDGTNVTFGAGKTLDVSAGTFTTSSAQKQAIVQAGPGSGTLDVSSGTFTTSTAQKTAILAGGAFPSGHLIKTTFVLRTGGTLELTNNTITTASSVQYTCASSSNKLILMGLGVIKRGSQNGQGAMYYYRDADFLNENQLRDFLDNDEMAIFSHTIDGYSGQKEILLKIQSLSNDSKVSIQDGNGFVILEIQQ